MIGLRPFGGLVLAVDVGSGVGAQRVLCIVVDGWLTNTARVAWEWSDDKWASPGELKFPQNMGTVIGLLSTGMPL